MDNAKRIDFLCRTLDITAEEAKTLIEFDKEIDRMSMKEVTSDLTAEQKAVIKKNKNADRKPTVYQFSQRKRTKDAEKVSIMENVAQSLLAIYPDVEIANAGQEITFSSSGAKFSLKLTKHR